MSNVRAEEHSLNPRQFQELCDMVYEITGIVLKESKREMVYRRLMRRIRELNVPSFSEYFQLLKTNDSEELPNFINAITTNLTSFYRESHHFDYLLENFLPEHEKFTGAKRRLRVWSSACSTGEEPYTLSITLNKYFGRQINLWDCKILATDLDTNVLDTSKEGVYKFDRIESLPTKIKKDWFESAEPDYPGHVRVNEILKDIITFKQLNLLNAWPMKGPFDVIFCRNVLIYFDRPTQEAILEKFLKILRPGGVLMLGHSESVAKGYSQLDPVGRTTYIKF